MRQVVIPKTDRLVINIPQEFVNKEIEIVIRPLPPEWKENRKEKLLRMFERYNVNLPEGYKFDREELHER
jgi:bifunctional DNA-binding transcriptional regulator/antitoxin component of YhaV-PrlF toxin-antitoxin module